MKSKKFPYLSLFIMCNCMLMFLFAHPVLGKVTRQPDSSTELQHSPFRVLACIAWWSHDAAGYHPAMLLMLENISGQAITGEEIPFQSRFTDLRNGYITIARDYKRTPVPNRERFVLLLRAPQSFELPIDSSSWPTMECKAMCRFPHKQGDDAETDNLFVTHLTRITMTDEDAHTQLIAQAEHNPLLTQHDTPSHDTPTDQTPLHQTPSYKTPPLNQSAQTGKADTVKPIKPVLKLPKRLPKVGDDFYVFEQLFGQAHEFQSGTNGSINDLTWAHYQASAPLFDIYAGSRNASKVDVLIVTVAAASIPKDFNRLSLAKLLAGCSREERITPYAHSVRYLPSGRSEIMTTGIRDRKILSFPLQEDDQEDKNHTHKIVILVTRLPGDPEAALATYRRRVNFLQI